MTLKPDALKTIPLFSELSPKELELLTHHLSVREYLAGQTIFELGDAAASCLFILDGEVGVYLDDADSTAPVATLTHGAPVGQMALIDGKRRSATCIIMSAAAHLVELRRDDFDRLMSAQTPFAYKILDKLTTDLVTRLRLTNERLVDARREQNQAALRKKTRQAAARLMGGPPATDNYNDLDPDSIQIYVPSLEQRMRERQDK